MTIGKWISEADRYYEVSDYTTGQWTQWTKTIFYIFILTSRQVNKYFRSCRDYLCQYTEPQCNIMTLYA